MSLPPLGTIKRKNYVRCPWLTAERTSMLFVPKCQKGEDPEDEFIEIFMNQFISAMNDRGVYFE